LIYDAVSNIYQSPIFYKKKTNKDVDNVLDVAKELLTTAKDIVTK